MEVERQPGPGEFESDGEEEVNLCLDCRSHPAVPGEVESGEGQCETPDVAGLAAGAAELDTVQAVERLGRLPDNFLVHSNNSKLRAEPTSTP